MQEPAKRFILTMLQTSELTAARTLVDRLLEHIPPYDPAFDTTRNLAVQLAKTLDTETLIKLPSEFQRHDKVNIHFPGNGTLKDCRVIKVAFDNGNGDEARYDLSVPYLYHNHPDCTDSPAYGFVRFHGLRGAFLRRPEWAIDGGPEWIAGRDER